jgi:hypothetical protein
MGVKVDIGGDVYEVTQFGVEEASTPLAAGDSSGQVGSISFNIFKPDEFVQPSNPINLYGLMHLIGKEVKLTDTFKGYTIGTIQAAQFSVDNSVIQISALSRLVDLNIYNISVEPFSGFLNDAFEYYLSLASIDTGFLVIDTEDRQLSTEVVAFPGWQGELWYNLKQMAAAIDCDISLVSGLIVLRPIRSHVATRGRDISRSLNIDSGNFARFIEVYQYNNVSVTDEIIYPTGGWNSAVEIISVAPGELVEKDLELSASVSSIVQPTMKTFIGPYDNSESSYTIIGDDGIPISPELWANSGGSLSISINPDSKSLKLIVIAPSGLAKNNGELINSFSIGLTDDSGSARYSTLRILGTGVVYNKQVKRFPTGVPESQASSEVGITIDNPFISTAADVNRTGIRTIRKYNGSQYTLNGSVVSVNSLGDSGIITGYDYAHFDGLYTGDTYEEVEDAQDGATYFEVVEALNEGITDSLSNQVFGNVAGARIWDSISKRWYRIRSATLDYNSINFSAEDDLMHEDIYNELFDGNTYEDVYDWYSTLTYAQVDLLGINNGQG